MGMDKWRTELVTFRTQSGLRVTMKRRKKEEKKEKERELHERVSKRVGYITKSALHSDSRV
jgi:hypothetical protein